MLRTTALGLVAAILAVLSLSTPTFAFEGEVEEVLNQYDRNFYEDCNAVLRAGYENSGVYRLYLENQHVLMPCKFHDGKAATLFLQRVSDDLTFHQNYSAYQHGFGNPKGNFWAGLKFIHGLTKKENKTLEVSLGDWEGNTEYLYYYLSKVQNAEAGYRLDLGTFKGTIAFDDFSYQNHQVFTTPDHEGPVGDCAKMARCGWWFGQCAAVLLTGKYYENGHYNTSAPMYDGIFYRDFKGYDYSLKYVSMAFH